LLGLRGATNVYGAQKGVLPDRVHLVDAALQRLAEVTDRRAADAAGAGAAGGLAFALRLLGAEQVAGIEFVTSAVGLEEHTRMADLVVTGEGAFDFSSRAGKVLSGVARLAQQALVPCIVLAGQVLVGSREMRTLGIESAYAMVDLVGLQTALDDPGGSLARLAERVARTWSR
jgi:glycerate 2-kinase